jgi:aminoglycoside 6-adenylyltransferase
MIVTHDPHDVIHRLHAWASRKETVRAMLLTSTRASPNEPVDIFSDYDVVLVVVDIRPFFTDRSWLQDFGQVLVVYWDPISPEPDYGIEQTGNVTQYMDGLKIDFRLWPVALAQQIAQAPALPARLDAGYTVILDKDHLTEGMRPPTYRAYIPHRPTEDAYQACIQEFFSDAPYVAKCLWRDELLPARWCLDCDMKQIYLRQLLEWWIERDHGWSLPAGYLGKGLKKRLPPEIWSQLERTYVGAEIAENWEALFATIALFRRVAIDVAAHLGYTYPHDLDQRVTTYVRAMQGMDHVTGSMCP